MNTPIAKSVIKNREPNKCCICGEEVKKPYSVIQNLENGKTRIYEGHKGCLSVVESRLAKGIEVPYEEFDTPSFSKVSVQPERDYKTHRKTGKKPSTVGIHVTVTASWTCPACEQRETYQEDGELNVMKCKCPHCGCEFQVNLPSTED